MQIFRLTILHFSSRAFLTSQVIFSGFRSLLLCELFCSHSEVKLVANIMLVAAKQKKGRIAEWSVHLVMDWEVSGSNTGGFKCFSNRLSFESNSFDISWFMLIIAAKL